MHRMRRILVTVLGVAMLALPACTPPTPPSPQQQVDSIISFVERTRGHSFVTRPTVDFESDAAFSAAVLANLDAQHTAVDQDQSVFRALGWITPGTDLFAAYRRAFSVGVVGFYDPASKVLKVRGTELTPGVREVIAHELTHALDDQVFGIDEDTGASLLDERNIAFLVAVEGSAARVQNAYFASMSAADQLQSTLGKLALNLNPALADVPLALISLTGVPYQQGPRFIDAAASHGGVPAGIDAVFARFPATEEQAWNPAKYESDEGAVSVPDPPADGTVVRSGTWGQFLLTLLVDQGISVDGSLDPVTNGWAGDAYVVWNANGRSCFRLDTEMDTAGEANALKNSLTVWTLLHPGATAVANGSTGVRLTACA